MPGVDDRDVARSRGRLVPTEEPRDLVERSLRRRERHPLERRVDEFLEPLEGEHQVRAALRGGHRVDLVDDDGLDAAERLARRRRQHQIEGFRRRDQDVGWFP
jgi:hypothetical protein